MTGGGCQRWGARRRQEEPVGGVLWCSAGWRLLGEDTVHGGDAGARWSGAARWLSDGSAQSEEQRSGRVERARANGFVLLNEATGEGKVAGAHMGVVRACWHRSKMVGAPVGPLVARGRCLTRSECLLGALWPFGRWPIRP
jgi:hypothetical protein